MRKFLDILSEKIWFLGATIAIRAGWLKQANVPIKQVEETINESLPTKISIEIPNGVGEVTVLNSSVDPSQCRSNLYISLWCSFDIDVMNSRVYQAHLSIELEASPHYVSDKKAIVFSPVDVKKVSLISDEYSLIKTSKSLLSLVTPKLMQSVTKIMGNTISLAANTMSGGMFQHFKDYAKLYEHGSKQSVLNYHLPQIKKSISEFSDSGGFLYELDMDIREEVLFSQLGDSVYVENDKMVFVFNR